MKKYLITGASGFIGSAIVKQLVKMGHFVRGLDNNSRGSAKRLVDLTGNFEFIQADIRDEVAVCAAAKGMDSILHLAFVNGTEYFYSKPDLVLDVGVRGMLSVIEACKSSSVNELVLASSSEVYQTPPVVPTPENVSLSVPDVLNPRYSYGGGKLISELMALHMADKWVDKIMIFRPHNVYGPDMGYEHVIPQLVMRAANQLQQFKTGAVPFQIQGDGKQTRSFIYIDDFVQGLCCVLSKGENRNIYHIGTEVEVEIRFIAKLLFDLLNREVNIITGESMVGGTLRRCPDITKLRQLGFSPEVSLREGLIKTFDWYNANFRQGVKV